MNTDRKQLISDLRGRLPLLFPSVRERLSGFLDKAEQGGTEENIKKLVELKNAAMSDAGKLAELNALRTLVVENFVAAMSNAGSFFTHVNLGESDEPILLNTTGQEMKARYIGEDGKPHMTQIVKNLARKVIELTWVSTDILEYPIVDIYRGRIDQDVMNAAPLARDLTIQIDQLLWALIKALPTNTFVTTGTLANRTFVLHSAVKAANVPTGNLLDLHTEGAFNFAIVKAIVKFFMQLGGVFGQVQAEAVFVPSVDVTGFIDAVTLTSDGTNPGVQQIFTDGYVTSLGGKRLIIVGDATLDPDDGTCYVRTNKPIGEWYSKPALDVTFPENPAQISAKALRENKGEMFLKKAFGAVTPTPWTVNMLAVKYK